MTAYLFVPQRDAAYHHPLSHIKNKKVNGKFEEGY